MAKGKPGTWEHGTSSGYNYCRKEPSGACSDCRSAIRDYRVEQRALNGQGGRRIAKADPSRPKNAYAEADNLEDLLNAW